VIARERTKLTRRAFDQRQASAIIARNGRGQLFASRTPFSATRVGAGTGFFAGNYVILLTLIAIALGLNPPKRGRWDSPLWLRTRHMDAKFRRPSALAKIN